MNGSLGVIRAIREVFPGVKIQRCLYHIKHQGQMWLRQQPKAALARDLKHLLKNIPKIESQDQRDLFWGDYLAWKGLYRAEIEALDVKDRVEGDIIRAYKMLENAYADMFHYLSDRNIEKTSNQLESFFSHPKRRYRGHAGLRRENLESYLKWYVYFHNT